MICAKHSAMISLLKKQSSWKKQEVNVTSKEHKKHSAIARPAYGNFARNEWAIVGTHCHLIQTLAGTIIYALSPAYQCAYVDAHHAHTDEATLLPGQLK